MMEPEPQLPSTSEEVIVRDTVGHSRSRSLEEPHRKQARQGFHCQLCDKSYQNSRSLRRHEHEDRNHLKLMGQERQNNYVCHAPDCGRAFARKWDLGRHVRETHDGHQRRAPLSASTTAGQLFFDFPCPELTTVDSTPAQTMSNHTAPSGEATDSHTEIGHAQGPRPPIAYGCSDDELLDSLSPQISESNDDATSILEDGSHANSVENQCLKESQGPFPDPATRDTYESPLPSEVHLEPLASVELDQELDGMSTHDHIRLSMSYELQTHQNDTQPDDGNASTMTLSSMFDWVRLKVPSRSGLSGAESSTPQESSVPFGFSEHQQRILRRVALKLHDPLQSKNVQDYSDLIASIRQDSVSGVHRSWESVREVQYLIKDVIHYQFPELLQCLISFSHSIRTESIHTTGAWYFEDLLPDSKADWEDAVLSKPRTSRRHAHCLAVLLNGDVQFQEPNERSAGALRHFFVADAAKDVLPRVRNINSSAIQSLACVASYCGWERLLEDLLLAAVDPDASVRTDQPFRGEVPRHCEPRTALSYATAEGQIACAALLLEYYAQSNRLYRLALIEQACDYRSSRLLTVLLAREPALESDALALCLRSSVRTFALGFLLQHRPSCHNLLIERSSSVEFAVRRRNPDNVELLIDHGADFWSTNEQGKSPAEIAAQAGNTEMLRLLTERLEERHRGFEAESTA